MLRWCVVVLAHNGLVLSENFWCNTGTLKKARCHNGPIGTDPGTVVSQKFLPLQNPGGSVTDGQMLILLRVKHSILQGSSLNRKVDNFRKFLKLTRLTRSLPLRVRMMAEIHSQTSRAMKKIHTRPSAWKRFRTTESVRKDSPSCWTAWRLCSVLQVPSFYELSPIWGGR